MEMEQRLDGKPMKQNGTTSNNAEEQDPWSGHITTERSKEKDALLRVDGDVCHLHLPCKSDAKLPK